MPGSSMGIVESYSGACGGARSCLAIDEARMWLLGKSCVSCLAGGERTRFLAGILFGNIFRSLEQHCGVRAAPRSRFLANLVESAKHSCRAPRSPAIRRSVRERHATARTRAEETKEKRARTCGLSARTLAQKRKKHAKTTHLHQILIALGLGVLPGQLGKRCWHTLGAAARAQPKPHCSPHSRAKSDAFRRPPAARGARI